MQAERKSTEGITEPHLRGKWHGRVGGNFSGMPEKGIEMILQALFIIVRGSQKTAFDAGADSVLPKPMSRSHVFKLISSSLPVVAGSVPEAPQQQAQIMKKKPGIFEVETFSSTTKYFFKIEIFFSKCSKTRKVVARYASRSFDFNCQMPHTGRASCTAF